MTVEQSTVVDHFDFFNLVLALPGSGKTLTLVNLICRLIEVASSKVIAVTFTNASSAEMKERVGKHIKGQQRKQIFISTFHSLLIQQVSRVPKLKSRKLLVGPEADNAFFYYYKKYNDTRASGKITLDEAREILMKKSCCLYPEQLDLGTVHSKFYEGYCNSLVNMGQWTMDMLCRDVVLGLKSGEIELLSATHIVVDEYQDTDELQYEWIKIHGQGGAKITVVGDDDQSIYKFRAAMGYSGMVKFKNDFEVVQHTLSKCFRCAPAILQAAKNLIEHNQHRIYKPMIAESNELADIELIGNSSNEEELERLAQNIYADGNATGAVLCRTNEQLDLVEIKLKAKGIEYQRLNSKSVWKSYQLTMGIKLIYSIITPNSSRYLKESLMFIKEDMPIILDIMNTARNSGFVHVQDENDICWHPSTLELQAMCRDDFSNRDVSSNDDIYSFLKKIEIYLRSHFIIGKKNEFATFMHGLLCIFNGRLSGRVEKILELMNTRERRSLDHDVITLTSFHGSKGLEFDSVWLVGVDEKHLPLANKSGEIDYEEERRLMFVAMTRAKKKLHISWAEEANYSSFLLEAFPDKILE